MAKKRSLRQQKLYSEGIRKEVVKAIEEGRLTVYQASRSYGACRTSIYNWIYKYSTTLSKGRRLVVEKDSIDNRIQDLERQNKELQAALGRKQMKLDLYEALIKVASEELAVDLKKSFGSKASEQK